MDARLRKLIGGRHERSENDITKSTRADLSTTSLNALNKANGSTQSSFRSKMQRFSVQPLEKVDSVRALSYDCTKAGKAPRIGGLPKKGNGPVKLAASRRAETGELLIMNETFDKTLQDIREGEYVVGKKERPSSTIQASMRVNALEAQPNSDKLLSTTPISRPATPRVSISQFYPARGGKASSHLVVPSVPYTDEIGLGLSTATRLLEDLRIARSCASSVHDNSRPSTAVQTTLQDSPIATLQALQKAEHGRLVAMYGQEDADRSIALLEKCRSSTSASPSPRCYSSVVIDQSPQPLEEPGSMSSRGSTASISGNSATWSDIPSKRHSTISLYTDSIVTAGSSSLEDDTSIRRYEVHRIVEQMRNNYLTVIQNSTPSVNRSPVLRRKKRSSRNSTPSSKPSSPQKENVVGRTLRTTNMQRWSWPAKQLRESDDTRKRACSADACIPSKVEAARASYTSYAETERPSLVRVESTTLGNTLSSLFVERARTNDAPLHSAEYGDDQSTSTKPTLEADCSNVGEIVSSRSSLDVPEVDLDLIRHRDTIIMSCIDDCATFEDLDDICDEAYKYHEADHRAWSRESPLRRKNVAPSISSVYSDSSSFINVRPRGSKAR